MVNVHFLRKLASDELKDTMFFCTGELPIKKRDPNWVKLDVPKISVKIITNRNITVNTRKCKSIPEAKWIIQHIDI
jgi:pimeloyl-CoA synthetase